MFVWSIRAIPTYRVYRLYDNYYALIFFSITAINVCSECAITAPSASYPYLAHHPSLKESVIAALMTLELNAIMKVRLH